MRRIDRIHELFDKALEREPPDRTTFLVSACAGDTSLQCEVELLLAHHARADESFLRPPRAQDGYGQPSGSDALEPPPTDALIGRRVGRYQLRSVIGHGGMATVYEAIQESPRRVVALKVMNRHVVGVALLRRFELESQLLGRLRHRGIAQIFEAGVHRFESGIEVAYFAMEYLPGAKWITEYADSKGLSVRERLALFAQVCDAVHHAHQRGIIHRDLKPANILVSEDSSDREPLENDTNNATKRDRRPHRFAQAKVIDFGVARSIDSDVALTGDQTSVGQLIGTLQYMSPEQCDGDPHDLDTRSDVYSLGVVLFELLTGSLPYDAGTVTQYQAIQAIKHAAPSRPSAVTTKSQPRELRGDIDTIVLKSVEKDREGRYGSAAGLADDLRRVLRKEPIAARPPTHWTRLARWIGRHPIAATMSLCGFIILATLGGLAATLYYLWSVPYSVMISPEARRATLLSIAGRVVWEWQGNGPGAIAFGDVFNGSGGFGNRRTAIGFGRSYASDPEMSRSLCLFNVEWPAPTLLWAARIEEFDAVPFASAKGWKGGDFACGPCGLVANVFDDIPSGHGAAPEIVQVFEHHSSTGSILRIYGLDEKPYYEIWHDASLKKCYWSSTPRQLILSGANGEVFWQDRGEPTLTNKHPRVLFAIRPTKAIHHEFLSTAPGTTDTAPSWYKCLTPPNLVEQLNARIDEIGAPANADAGGVAQILIGIGAEELLASISFDIDASGEIIEASRAASDGYSALHSAHPDQYPDFHWLRLNNLPPVSGQTRLRQTDTPRP